MASTDYTGQLVFSGYASSSLDDSEEANSYSFVVGSDLDDSEEANDITFLVESNSLCDAAVTPGIITYYSMRAIDPDCPTLTYVSWVVQDQPDLTGSQYVGSRCGATPLTDITIAAKWQV